MSVSTVSAAPLIQGIPSPSVVVNPSLFYKATRRLRFPMQGKTAISGIGGSDQVQLRQTGIVAGLEVRISGKVVVGGTIGTTTCSYKWPHGFIKNFTLSANGQSQLVSASGLRIRALECAMNPKLTDHAVSQKFGGTAYTNGTLGLSCDDWGTGPTPSTDWMAPGSNIATIGDYTVDVTYFIPVAADPVSLVGSIYAQSSATNLTLGIQYATQADLMSAVGASATMDWSNLNWEVVGVVYTIPNVGGQFVIPDLTQFHQISEFQKTGLGQSTNQIPLTGVGIGRYLLRILANVYSSSAPLAVNDTNYNLIGWAFGGSDTPEQYQRGGPQRARNLRETGVDLGKLWGLILLDFASEHALRDVIDEGTVSDLRLELGLVSAPTTGYAVVCQETLFAAPVGA